MYKSDPITWRRSLIRKQIMYNKWSLKRTHCLEEEEEG